MILQFKNLALLGAILGLFLTQVCSVGAVDIPSDASSTSLLTLAKAARARNANTEAIAYLDAAVSKDPSSYLAHYQRGITYLFIGKTVQAKADFDSTLQLKPGFEGALLQRAKIGARNAEWEFARKDYLAVGDRGVEGLSSLEEAEGAAFLAVEAEAKQDWETCVNQAGVAIMTATAALSLRQLRARCRFELGEVEMGVSDLAHVLQISPGSVEPHLQMSSMLFYSLGDAERGLSQARKCLQSDPDSKPCKLLLREEKSVHKSVEKINSLISSKSYISALKLLLPTKDDSEPGLLAEVRSNVESHRSAGYIHSKAPSNLYNSILERVCECYLGSGNKKAAATYCAESLAHNPHSLQGLLHQAQTQVDAEQYEAAIQTLNTAKEQHPDSAQQINDKLHSAQVALKQSKQKDYYKALGVARDADDRTIKRAYRAATKLHHPDKATARGLPKEQAEAKMASINEAYEVLSDPDLKARYDNGEDPNDPLANQGGNPFQGSPFGGGGGQQFFFQQGGFPGGGQQRQFKFSQGAGGQGGMPFGAFPGFG